MATGWSAIFSDNIVNDLSLPPACLYKVSHHGSDTGHHPDIWDKLLAKSPLSVATTYTRSGLPTYNNIQRIKQLSSEFWITRDSAANKKIKRDSMVERELKAIAKNRKTINDKMGHIQLRISNDGSIQIAANDSCIRYATDV